MDLAEFADYLACPSTHRPLRIVELGVKNASDSFGLIPVRRSGMSSASIGVTDRVLMPDGMDTAYPVVGEFPVLLAPELLVPERAIQEFEVVDLTDPRYAEAYQEMEVYNALCNARVEAAMKSGYAELRKPMGALKPSTDFSNATFPFPEHLWVDALHDSLSQLEAYSYLAPVRDRVVMQLGGSGTHAVKMLCAGASRAFLVTPMTGEARVAMTLAQHYGVAEKLGCVIGIGEEIPFANDTVDLVYSGGCFHHMRLRHAARQLHRILRPEGKFAAVDPWKTPLHTIGTALIGKREKSIFCKPITPDRMAPLYDYFGDMLVKNHGPLLRYLFLAFEKLGLRLPVTRMLSVGRFDDAIGASIGLKRFGGSLMVAGTKQPAGM